MINGGGDDDAGNDNGSGGGCCGDVDDGRNGCYGGEHNGLSFMC